MLEYLSWAANTALFVGCCFLTSDIANLVFDSVLTPTPTAYAAGTDPTPLMERTWSDRSIILSRNLFNSSTLSPDLPPVPETEDLEATKLPLKLLGTASATNDFYSWAAIEDLDSKDTVVLRVGDEIRPTATVMRIERRRVVLDENGNPRELVLTEKSGGGGGRSSLRSKLSRSSRARRRTASNRSRRPPVPSLRKLDEDRFEVPPGEIRAALDDPGTLLQQARFMPKFEGGEMIGLQVNNPKPGSIFQQVGIQSGDVIIEINGTSIDSAVESRKVLQAFETNKELDIVVLTKGGETRSLSLSASGR